MNWTTITKAKANQKMPDNIIRLSRTSIAVSENIAETLQLGRENLNDDWGEKVRIGIAIDKDNKSIKLIPNDLGGFTFFCRNHGYKNLNVRVPVGLKKADMPIGDYLATDVANLEFRLAQ